MTGLLALVAGSASLVRARYWFGSGTAAAVIAAIATCVLILCARSVQADSWKQPEARTVVSRNGGWSAAMTPGDGTEAKADIVVAPKAGPGGWRRELLNDHAPVDLFLSDDGALVTCGDWHQEGYEHAIAIYDSKGKVVADRRLEDFMTKDELDRTRETVSSRWWRYTSEVPEFAGKAFALTTAWGTTLRFDLQSGRVARDPGSFGRFRSYCDGTRPAREVVIIVSRVWKKGDRYDGRHCDVRRTGARCRAGERYVREGKGTTITFAAGQFDAILKDAGVVTPYIVNDGVYKYDRSFIHIQMAFGDTIRMNDWGGPEGGDRYWIQYKPAAATPAAREWTTRLEALVRAPR